MELRVMLEGLKDIAPYTPATLNPRQNLQIFQLSQLKPASPESLKAADRAFSEGSPS